MKSGKIYSIDHTEYLVLDGTCDMMPGREGLKQLSDRRQGVGADYVMIFTGTEQEPSFLLYRSDGKRTALSRESYAVLAKYLRETHAVPNVPEMVRHLGEQALSAGSEKVSTFEVRITNFFWKQVLQADCCGKSKDIA